MLLLQISSSAGEVCGPFVLQRLQVPRLQVQSPLVQPPVLQGRAAERAAAGAELLTSTTLSLSFPFFSGYFLLILLGGRRGVYRIYRIPEPCEDSVLLILPSRL